MFTNNGVIFFEQGFTNWFQGGERLTFTESSLCAQLMKFSQHPYKVGTVLASPPPLWELCQVVVVLVGADAGKPQKRGFKSNT